MSSEIFKKMICPYCGEERHETWVGCCGETHRETVYMTEAGEERTEAEYISQQIDGKVELIARGKNDHL